MRQYPVSVPRDYYSGSNPSRRRKAQDYNRVADRIEKHLNGEVAKWADDMAGSIMSHDVASAIGEDRDLVQRIVFRIDGGHNGVTIWKGDYEKAVHGGTL